MGEPTDEIRESEKVMNNTTDSEKDEQNEVNPESLNGENKKVG